MTGRRSQRRILQSARGYCCGGYDKKYRWMWSSLLHVLTSLSFLTTAFLTTAFRPVIERGQRTQRAIISTTSRLAPFGRVVPQSEFCHEMFSHDNAVLSSQSPIATIRRGREELLDRNDEESSSRPLLLHEEPPTILRALEVLEGRYVPFEPLEITRVALDPPIFVVRNFCPHSEYQTLLQEAVTDQLQDASIYHTTTHTNNKSTKNMNSSACKSNNDNNNKIPTHRQGSAVAWIRGTTNADDEEKEEEEEEAEHERIARLLTQIASSLFVNNGHKNHHLSLASSSASASFYEDREEQEESSQQQLVVAEPLQVVRYDPGGKFDLHHDGLDRTVTVLTYLNGIAGTWFPFVDAPDEDFPSAPLSDRKGALQGKEPGKDGLWIVGDEAGDTVAGHNSSKVVRVRAGDAVVFYNYVGSSSSSAAAAAGPPPRNHPSHEEDNSSDHSTTRRIMINWRAIHCALPAPCTKWICTHWFHLLASSQQ